MRESVIGIQPRPGCTPLAAPSQFSQYPCSTFAAGRDFTPHVPPVGEVVGELDGLRLGLADALGLGLADGEVVRLGLGDGDEVPPVQVPRSFHSDGVAAGFHPAPTYAVCVTSAW
ncbi:hypothetical protein GCM10007977_039620 [Dactylosporangium sucinum]|uniref:Uncharacterized protein n=1 Tax=Dactylosporangium sucinum TaxID=1424081 RepID=A0A917TR28_9ACTN|nr:hypothetical protein GCM10007977_039620 [Dactylosporangium sucinum]